MKFYVLVLALFVACASASLMSMVPELPDMNECQKLKFLIDSENTIKMYRIKTTVKAPVNNIRGLNLFTLLPSNGYQLKDLKPSYPNQNTVRMILKLEDKEFLAKMSPVHVGFGLPYYLVTMKSLNNL